MLYFWIDENDDFLMDENGDFLMLLESLNRSRFPWLGFQPVLGK